ncbi:DNA topoisomerase III [Paenibacillus oryzae]|uniref:DNA topoisomerase n=1 Tax=Paenibacillus oryzae TaxID=1844972 RepID=A0A1A5YMX4_9BACL|nr:type IA DNA topoisomerase [Paenibacillus oryzae]OBR66961.1 DNA topoisomerase III [Paenibacillus oryzae]
MKTLIIAEKPDMGRNIAAVIEPRAKNHRTYLEGEHYIITWAIGHLIGLAEPDAYDVKYKKWNINDLPIIPEAFKLVANRKTADQLKVIKELAKRSGQLVNCCDAGREGQYIFSLIQRHLKLRQPVKRLWISDLTPESIRKGFDELKDGSEYDNLTKAATARSEADWLIGMNGSRAFTTKHNVLLSVGRVQTPVLALIYDRQKLIEAFSSLKYYVVEAMLQQGETSFRGIWMGDRLTDSDKAGAIAAKVSGKSGIIESYEVKDVKEYPFKLYDLTLLQREANGRYGFSAKKTLDIAQVLYEKHKVISYPRTNSNYVTEQNIPEMHKALSALQGTAYDKWASSANRALVHKGNKFICNPARVEDHHAILPTTRKAGELSGDEAKLYDLIVKRFLSQFYPPAEYKSHAVVSEVEKERFKSNIKELQSLGWKIIYKDEKAEKTKDKTDKAQKEQDSDEEVEVAYPFRLDKEQGITCTHAEAKEKETQPPKPFTEGTLLKAMESAGKDIEDGDVRDAMKDSGLGTPATRAATIERLKKVEYIAMQGKRIVITQKGKTAIELIRAAGVELLTSPEMTGMWEKRLSEIARGTASNEQFMENVKKFATMIVQKAKGQVRIDSAAFQNTDMPAKGGRGSSKGTTRSTRAASSRSTANAGTASKKSPVSSRTAASSSMVNNGTTAPVSRSQQNQPSHSQEPQRVAACPRPGCGGYLFMGRKGYGCSHYKTGCGFVIWKESFGRKLSDTQVKALAEKGKTAKLKLTVREGEVAEGKIVLLDSATGKLGVEI